MDLKKLNKLKKIISEMKSVLIAFSGGVDSTFLAKIAYDVLGKKAVAVTAVSPSYPKHELKEARKFADEIGIEHLLIESHENDMEDYKRNPSNRCYYCKKELFTKLKILANNKRVEHVIYGANHDDLKDHRPGSLAACEFGVRAPLEEAKMTKKDIRQYSRKLGLGTYAKPALACLSSRIPYGEKITQEKLDAVDKAESFIKRLGIKQLRVRHHENIARIEVDKKDFNKILSHSQAIDRKLKQLGFYYAALDIAGYKSGSMNKALDGR